MTDLDDQVESQDESESTGDQRRALGLRIEPLRGVRDLWQVPLLLVGGVLAVLGAMIWIKAAPGPDFDGALDDAETLIDRRQYDRALEILNGPMLDELGHPDVDESIRGRLHGLRGDALYLSMHERLDEFPADVREVNYEKVLGEYDQAEQFDHDQMTPRRHGFLAEAQLDRGHLDEALDHIDQLSSEMASRKRGLERRYVEASLAQSNQEGFARAGAMLESMRSRPDLETSERHWILARQTEIRLANGHIDRALDELLPEVSRLEERETTSAGELFLLLGQAYLELGRFDRAREHLKRAETVFIPGDERRGEAEVRLARIAQTQGQLEEARDRYSSVIERFPGMSVEAQALLGLGEVEADLGRHQDSLLAFGALVEALRESGDSITLRAEDVELSMAQRHRARLHSGDLEIALGYAQLILEAYDEGEATPEAVERLAQTHEALGDHLLGRPEGQELDPREMMAVDPATMEAARLHYESAGELFERHTAAVVVRDPESASMSMWRAAEAFDRAGNKDRAIDLFTEFMQAKRRDPAALAAKFRLARAFQARGEHATAITLFEEIIEENPRSDEAYRSYVPLAQSHLMRGENGDSQDAQRWLVQVVSGRMFEPSALQFRQALLELGRLHLAEGSYADSIVRLREALDRYPDLTHRAHVEFDLGDALRLSAAKIERDLQDAMPASDRAELAQLRVERLEEGLERYESVRQAIDRIDVQDRSTIDHELHRNSSFYRADCAYDLGRFDDAIRHYDAAAQRYADEPASLVAIVQIVNCYVALERWREAQTAHARAQKRLRELPESAWSDASIPMDRRHWEQWLESSILIEQMMARADVDPAIDED